MQDACGGVEVTVLRGGELSAVPCPALAFRSLVPTVISEQLLMEKGYSEGLVEIARF